MPPRWLLLNMHIVEQSWNGEQCNVQHALGGLEAVEGYLSTDVDLTKQVKPSFALPPTGG